MPDARHQTIMRVPHTVHKRRSGHSTANIRRKALRLSDLRVLAYLSGQHTMSAVAAHFGVHYTTVSRLVKAYEADQKV